MDFKRLLQDKTIRFADFVDAEFGERAANLMLGCCVVVLSKGMYHHVEKVNALRFEMSLHVAIFLVAAGKRANLESFQVDESTIAIGCWKGRASLTVMVTATDCQELLERLLVRLGAEQDSSVLVDKQSHNVGDEREVSKGKTSVAHGSS